MAIDIDYTNEKKVSAAFNAQSVIFDALYRDNKIVDYKRQRVREHLLKFLEPGSHILELNAGTGDDAIYFAKKGFHVHATDISEGMQDKLSGKLTGEFMTGSVSQEICSFTNLDALKKKGPYDCIFSNFAGLNCTGQLEKVLGDFDGLVKPGGMLLLVILPRFCLWETLLVFRGRFKTAFRRFFSSGGRRARIEDSEFTCWYHSPRFVKRHLKDKFEMMETEGLCAIVPPSYIERFPEKYPSLYAGLCSLENRLKGKWPWKHMGDYYIISFRKKSQ